MTETSAVPAGYWKDGDGRLIPESMIKDIDRTRDQLVRDLAEYARKISVALAEFKAIAFSDVEAFIDLSAQEYGVKIGGKKGNITLTSFDRKYKVTRQIADSIVFDERLQAAKALIDECIHEWSADSRDEIKALINDAFQVSQQGNINTSAILRLKQLNITYPKWLSAMQAIADSVQVSNSKPYVRIYERVGDTDKYELIPLDISNV